MVEPSEWYIVLARRWQFCSILTSLCLWYTCSNIGSDLLFEQCTIHHFLLGPMLCRIVGVHVQLLYIDGTHACTLKLCILCRVPCANFHGSAWAMRSMFVESSSWGSSWSHTCIEKFGLVDFWLLMKWSLKVSTAFSSVLTIFSFNETNWELIDLWMRNSLMVFDASLSKTKNCGFCSFLSSILQKFKGTVNIRSLSVWLWANYDYIRVVVTCNKSMHTTPVFMIIYYAYIMIWCKLQVVQDLHKVQGSFHLQSAWKAFQLVHWGPRFFDGVTIAWLHDHICGMSCLYSSSVWFPNPKLPICCNDSYWT